MSFLRRLGGIAVLAAVVATAVSVAGAAPVSAGALPSGVPEPQPTVSAPTVELDRYQIRPGDQVTITVAGFTRPGVFATVCGNDALRGSVDCNMSASEGIETEDDGRPDSQIMVVQEPPVPCPCVIRVANSDNSEVAYADITLVGHPTAPVQTSTGLSSQPLSVSIAAEEAPTGVLSWLQSSLGGATVYDVTVVVQNDTTTDATGVVVDVGVGDNENEVDDVIQFPAPGEIRRGETWSQTVQFELGSPVFGSAVWRADVSSDRPTVQATDTTSHLPGMLVLAIVLLVTILLLLAIRLILRMRARRIEQRDPGDGSGGSSPDGGPMAPGPVIDLDDEFVFHDLDGQPIETPSREHQPV